MASSCPPTALGTQAGPSFASFYSILRAVLWHCRVELQNPLPAQSLQPWPGPLLCPYTRAHPGLQLLDGELVCCSQPWSLVPALCMHPRTAWLVLSPKACSPALQSSRIDDQRCAPPDSIPRGPTMPDEDFFSLIQRVQAKRMDEQRVDLASAQEEAAEEQQRPGSS